MPQDSKSAPESHLPEPLERSEKTAMLSNPAPGVGERPSAAPPAEAVDPLIGKVIGSFQILRKLGGGGMGTVYLGQHTIIGSKVAVKFLHDHFASNEVLVQRFLAEAKAVNLIGHENIVNIFDLNVLPPRRHYLVMEYLEGSPLSSLTGSPADPSVVIPILTQVCDALQAAHAHGVVHRDLKPENVMLVRHDRTPHFVKVLDFGIAKLFDAEKKGQTLVGTLIGTPGYMAPEQWTGPAVDGRTDLYALGIIAYELLTGRMPFPKGPLGTLLHSHLKVIPPTPRAVNPGVPEVLSQLIMRTLAKRPEDRFQTANELRAALEQALPSEAAAPRSSTTPVPQAIPEPPPAVALQPTMLTPWNIPALPATVDVMARVVLQPGAEPSRVRCTDLSRNGVFLCTSDPLPALRSRLSLTLELREQPLTCTGEVVHHVPPAQASAWGTRAGFAVQFLNLPTEARELLARSLQGHTAPSPRNPSSKAPLVDDAEAGTVLATLAKPPQTDPYALLSLPLDAPFDDIRQHARNTLRTLEALATRPLSARQTKELNEVRARVEKAGDLLGHPRQRIEHDAWRGNFAGVARCISSGLTASEIEALRTRFLQAHPGAEARERIHATTASAWESQGNLSLALAEYEKALAAVPLSLSLQQRYWSLKQRGLKATPPPAGKGPEGTGPRRPGRS
ncbi:serine/threonine protein kinase [Stigmatella aurantiaca]|uniref:non-specific serine/threonine protein kinase n=1 Tax=Stigmatella aurantiaca (strain DW4/3-1) TaxID=378806 RepID=Q08MX8_STIAD|nr:serine/threonine-protein kinase [Stigmatella aurantiaca]ADO70775.1 Serine/threonine protein kinase [Stigmatella aurantiaca DW4/3-1]EAU61838.1 serine/threonine-protein kinase Pkn1 [Stigmatella aurantiaca DW4/3-1]